MTLLKLINTDFIQKKNQRKICLISVISGLLSTQLPQQNPHISLRQNNLFDVFNFIFALSSTLALYTLQYLLTVFASQKGVLEGVFFRIGCIFRKKNFQFFFLKIQSIRLVLFQFQSAKVELVTSKK